MENCLNKRNIPFNYKLFLGVFCGRCMTSDDKKCSSDEDCCTCGYCDREDICMPKGQCGRDSVKPESCDSNGTSRSDTKGNVTNFIKTHIIVFSSVINDRYLVLYSLIF